MGELGSELMGRWRKMFSALAAGDDVPPSARLRAEGMMESAVLLGLATPAAVIAAMDGCYRDAFGHSMVDDFGEDWGEFYPFPQIPAVGRRAPVYPSTRD